jgi:putative iron-regulated protein
MSERMAVSLDSGDQEDEHSCFSDTTHQDFVYDVKGIADVWFGAYAGAAGPGLDGLVGRVDPRLAEEIRGLIDDTTAKIAILGDPWDRVLASPAGSLARERGEAAVAALGALADGLKRAGAKLGVLVQIPSE